MLDAAWVRWAGAGSLSVRERRVCGKGNLASIGRTARHVSAGHPCLLPWPPTPAPGPLRISLSSWLSMSMLHICRLFFLQSACGTPFLSTPPRPAIGTLERLELAPFGSCLVRTQLYHALSRVASHPRYSGPPCLSRLWLLASVTLVTRGCHARPLDALGRNGTPSMQQGASALDAFC
jgi:hypothetical protein